jgi:hypothetical protein
VDCQLSFDRDLWTAPVDASRLHPTQDADQVAACQIRALMARLPASGQPPLFVFDGGYDSAQLTLDLADLPIAVLVRLRSDRCFYADPPPAARSPKGGRPRRHGAKFNCADPTTWPTPTATLACEDDQYGTVTVNAWSGLHPKQQRHPGHGSRGPRPIVRGTILRVQVQRVPARTRPPKVLWLWWAGPGAVDLNLAWRAYVRRFDIEHTVRFAKQTLGWTTPRPRHPAQADRWTWLVLAGYAQLRLAREIAADQRLPWERPALPVGCRRCECAEGFRGFSPGSARRLPHQNPPAAPQAGPRAPLRARAPPPGDQEIRQEGQQDAAQGREGGLTGPDQHHPTAGTASGKPRTPTGLNHKLSEHAAKTGKRSERLCRGHKLRLAELVAVAHELHRVLLR